MGQIYLAQVGWRRLKEEKPQEVDLPMRNTLLECVFKELKKRLSEIKENKDVYSGVVKAKWLKDDNGQWSWSYLRWEPAAKALIPDESKEPLAHGKIFSMLDLIIRHSRTSGTVSRLHPMRPVVQEMKGDSVGFLLQLPLRGQATDELLGSLHALCSSSATQLIAAQLKTHRAQRSQLANSVAKLL